MTVYQQQCLLAYLGYSPGAIDGQMGANTSAAVKRFQADYYLDADGVCGPATEKMMIGAVAGTVSKRDPATAAADPTEDVPAESDPFAGIQHFRPEEFVCKCGGKYCNGDTATMDRGLLLIDEKIRNHFGVPVTITSGIRCRVHNANVGGVANSRHLSGHANDLIVRGFSASMVLSYVQTLPGVNYSYDIDGSAVHIDTI